MDKYKVTIQAMCEVVVSHDSPVEAQAVAEKLFVDDISGKSEMFSVRMGRVRCSPYRERLVPKRTAAEINRAKRKRYRYAWGLWLQGLTLKRVAEYLNVTRSRAEQILHGHIRITRRRHPQLLEGDNWEARSDWRPPLSSYRARTVATNQFTPPPNPSIL